MSQKQLEKKEAVESTGDWEKDEDVSDDAEVIKLEIGDSIEGILLEKKPSDIFGMVYKIKTRDSELPKIICGTTILNKRMGPREVGEEVRILRIADVKTSKGRFAHQYDTFHKKAGE